jgi:hypothetical protein
MQVYLYPGYVSLDSIEGESTRLFKLLETQGVELEERNWGGTLESLPKNPSIVRASSMMKCGEREFGRKCAELGHFAFYYDSVILADGTYSQKDFIPKLEEWLAKNGNQQMDPALVIPYLQSESKDTSTVGSGDHTKRKAKLTLKLWGEHVVDATVQPSAKFSNMYPVIKLGADDNSPDMLQRLGFDFKTIRSLQEQVEADIAQIAGIETSNPDVQSLYQKLRVGLEQNLSMLEHATLATNVHYALGDAGLMGLELFLGTFQSRHNTDSGGAAVHMFLRAMLPILIAKLTTLGYTGADAQPIEWDYNEPPKAHGLQTLSAGSPLLGVSISHALETPQRVKCANCGHFEVNGWHHQLVLGEREYPGLGHEDV